MSHARSSHARFLAGFASSTFQDSGEVCGPSNWTEAARKGTVGSAGKSVEHWDKYESDFEMMRETGANAFRFSLEWPHIQKAPGEFDEAVLQHYDDMLDACIKRGIEPMLTLFHFTEPVWFAEKGGFEHEENIEYFIRFCEAMFQRFSGKVKLWCTINEPAVYGFSGYWYGQFPPHKKNLQLAVNVIANLMKAHVSVYQALKASPNGADAQIGIVHNYLKFIPRYKWEPIEIIAAKIITGVTNNIVMSFLKTGVFNYHFPGVASKRFEEPRATSSFDFFGLNFYANPVIGFNTRNGFGPTHFPGQIMGDMYLPIDSKGFNEAITACAALGKPVYVTEMGIADNNDTKRAEMFHRYLAVITEVRANGVDVRGCFCWTLTDNFEWNESKMVEGQLVGPRFGLFTPDRQLKFGAATYINFMRANNPLSTAQPALDLVDEGERKDSTSEQEQVNRVQP